MLRHIKKIFQNRKLVFRFLQTIYKKKYMPLTADLNITKYCNLKCKHCYAVLDTVKDCVEPTTEEIKKIIDGVYALGTRWIRLVGGEPLIREDVGELIKYIKAKGVFCELNTNGLLIKSRLDELRHVDALLISLDGGKEENDLLRGKDSWEKIIEGIEAAVGAGLTPRLHCVLTKQTQYSLDSMNRIAKKYNLRFNLGDCSRISNKDINFSLTKEEEGDFYDKYLRAKEQGAYISNSRKSIELVRRWPIKQRTIMYEDVRKNPRLGKMLPECQLGYKSVMIDVDGNIYSCPRRWKEGINYKDVGIEEAWRYASDSRRCYTCNDMGCIEKSFIFSGNIPSIYKVYVGYV